MAIQVFNSAERIVTQAMFDATLLEEGQTANSDQMGNNLQRLTDMVNIWAVQGIKLHLLQDAILPLVAGVNNYTIGPGGALNMTRPMRVEDAYYVTNFGENRPVSIIARHDWDRLSTSTGSNGAVNQLYPDIQSTFIKAWLWSTPSTVEASTGALHLILRTQATQYTAASQTLGFPIEWYMALRWGLASELSTGAPTAIINRCENNAEKYKQILEGWDTEVGPVQFQPDAMGTFQGSRFR